MLALAAGVDALLIGHDLGEEAVAAVQRGARRRGRCRRARRGAAARGGGARRAGRGVGRAAPRGGRVDGDAGRTSARRALVRRRATCRSAAPPLVVELRPRANIAAGEAGHSLGAVLAERLAGTETVVLDEASADAGGASPCAAAGDS